jgi:outer membrane biosynthesis protein TonB
MSGYGNYKFIWPDYFDFFFTLLMLLESYGRQQNVVNQKIMENEEEDENSEEEDEDEEEEEQDEEEDKNDEEEMEEEEQPQQHQEGQPNEVQKEPPTVASKISKKVNGQIREYDFLTTVKSMEELDKIRHKVMIKQGT